MITEETRLKMRLAHLGKKPSEETRKKMSLAMMGNKKRLGIPGWLKGTHLYFGHGGFEKGHVPWNKGKKIENTENYGRKPGFTPWNKGRKYLEISGEKHWSWKGGVSREYEKGYWSLEYKIWRMKVFKRDDFTCQHCGKRGLYLHAHHIKSFAHYPKLRFKVSNGSTLCKDCHKKTKNFGYKNRRRNSCHS